MTDKTSNQKLNELLELYPTYEIVCPHCKKAEIVIYKSDNPQSCYSCKKEVNYLDFWKPVDFTKPEKFVKLLQCVYSCLDNDINQVTDFYGELNCYSGNFQEDYIKLLIFDFKNTWVTGFKNTFKQACKQVDWSW